MSLVVSASIRHPLRLLVERESVLAPACGLALLLHPTPLSWPALVLGLLPSITRLVTIGRPWRPTSFDAGLALFGLGALVGQLVSLEPADGAVRVFGLAAGFVLFAWVRECAISPDAARRAALIALAVVAVGALLMLHVAQPFLLFNRTPPLGWLAALIEPLGLYRLLVADEFALQRFRLYASGAGAVAATGLSMSVGLGLTAVDGRRRGLAMLGGLGFGALLLASDNRGSMLAAALAIGGLIVWWRPRLLLLAVLLVFGTLDLIALGVVQRGLSLRTLLERTDFWWKGLELAVETPFTGVGLGVTSVQQVYRTAFQPSYPPFNHAHSIFVQALLEQGVLGLGGLGLLCLAVVRLGPARRDPADARLRSASFVALGGILALLAAGLTEIVAVTTVGGALLFGLLGLLAASHDADLPDRAVTRGWPGWTERAAGRALSRYRPTRLQAIAVIVVLVGLAAMVIGRPLAASGFLNIGTSALYRGTLQRGLTQVDRAQSMATAVRALQSVIALDPDNVAALRNLALAEAASGQKEQARQHADEARARVLSEDRDAIFGIGRAYVAAGAWDEAIAAWSGIGAGPQLLDLGRQLVQGPDWPTGNAALIAAARVGAPGRSAADAITRAAQARGLATDAIVEEIQPLLDVDETGPAKNAGIVRYFAWLQAAHVYRQAGQPDRAESALAQAEQFGLDPQIELERGLIRVAEGRLEEAEAALTWIVAHSTDDQAPVGLPDGDDPHYWLAVVQSRLGKPEQALATARNGVANLTADQGSLRGPYQGVIGESLLSLGRPSEALAAFRFGLRIAPSDPILTDGARRAQAATAR